ncbi:unnamed protein product [Phytomonas sp. Hart1]|nr:unnamed protein product [Phytomonas sp. Hart1]|eukprot:CCW66939.1 unnamed protein product [Phytomonas sp. isolate Hart1]
MLQGIAQEERRAETVQLASAALLRLYELQNNPSAITYGGGGDKNENTNGGPLAEAPRAALDKPTSATLPTIDEGGDDSLSS